MLSFCEVTDSHRWAVFSGIKLRPALLGALALALAFTFTFTFTVQ